MPTSTKNRYATTLMGVLLATSLLSACNKAPEVTKPTPSSFRPTATVQEIMQSIIDPNIDAVWNSVATISTKAGVEERAPKSDDEWREVRQHALVVAEASNLLLIDGRQIAAKGASTSSHAVELSPGEIEKGIQSHRADFVKHAHDLQAATQEAIDAIDHKDTQRLVQAGGRIDQVCEQCHVQFWYPNDKPPLQK